MSCLWKMSVVVCMAHKKSEHEKIASAQKLHDNDGIIIVLIPRANFLLKKKKTDDIDSLPE